MYIYIYIINNYVYLHLHMHIVSDIAWRGSKIANAIYVMGCSGGLTQCTPGCLLHVLEFVGLKPVICEISAAPWCLVHSFPVPSPFVHQVSLVQFQPKNHPFSCGFAVSIFEFADPHVCTLCFACWTKTNRFSKNTSSISQCHKFTIILIYIMYVLYPPFTGNNPDPPVQAPFFEGGFPGGLQQLVGTLRPSASHFAHLSTLAAFGEAAARPARGADVAGLRALDNGNMAIFRASYH